MGKGAGKSRNPIWEEVEIDTCYGTSGTKKWKCKHCGGSYSGSMPRVKSHLLGLPGYGIAACQGVSDEVVLRLGGDPNILLGSRSRKRQAPLGSLSSSCGAGAGIGSSHQTVTPMSSEGTPGHAQGQFRPTTSNIRRAWDSALAEEADVLTRKFFYACAIPFNVARTPAFQNFVRGVARAGSAYRLPTSEALRTTSLKKEVTSIEKDLLPMREAWKRYGCTILSDGWSDTRKRSIINILVSSCMGTMFLRSIDASEAGVRHTGEYIYNHIRKAILDVGVANVVQVVTDNASNCVSMGNMLESEFPSIVWTPCASHCLDLLMEDIAKLPWVHDLVSIARRIVTFVTRKHKALSIYRKYNRLEILKPAKTRFAYLFIVLARLIEVKPELRRMVVSPKWIEWEGSREPKAKAIESYIFNPSFWHDAESLLGAIKPIVTILRLMDREGSTMGLLYEMMDRLGESLTTCTCLSAERVLEIDSIRLRRWDWFHRPIHAVAHILHPLWRKDTQMFDEELCNGWNTYTERVYPDLQGYCGESTSTAAGRHIRISLSQSSSSSSPSSSVNLRLHDSSSPFSHYHARPCSDGHYIVCPVNGKRLVLTDGTQSIQDLRCNEGSSFSSMQSLPKLISASEREWIGSSEFGWDGGMGMELDGNLLLERLSATLSPQEGLKARSPSTGRQNCSLCWRKLSQRSPWSSYRLLTNDDLPAVGVLSCGHVYHADCLEQATPALQKHDPLCPHCDGSKKGCSKKKGHSFLHPGKKLMGLMRPNSSRNGRKNSRIGVLMDDSKKGLSLEHPDEKVPVTISENRGSWGASLLSAFGSAKAARFRGHPFATQQPIKDKSASNPVVKKHGSPAGID